MDGALRSNFVELEGVEGETEGSLDTRAEDLGVALASSTSAEVSH